MNLKNKKAMNKYKETMEKQNLQNGKAGILMTEIKNI